MKTKYKYIETVTKRITGGQNLMRLPKATRPSLLKVDKNPVLIKSDFSLFDQEPNTTYNVD